ncbi:hypothetical protein ZIOFF_013971 [Zingiber officinale]|uniref:Chaperone DnaJ C-terminal domain-containing protein n=1 Tax=Zingiber officinale TaxID=94328 RepID=A0A8J5HGM9_ZINOF|nr:hypothetical protein ZIOFF_013971 [Zingiber officinale]
MDSNTSQLYSIPHIREFDILISVEDFSHHIELAIQTHGYEEWNIAESNLLITRGLIARLTNTSYAGFRYNVQNVADYLASAGIHAVASSPRTIIELQGMRWFLQPPATSQIRNPQEVRTSTLMDGSISLSFLGYQAAKNPQARRLSSFDTEELRNEGEEEFAGVFISFIEGYGQPDTTEKWDTLGEPSGSIWEDTPWEDDPYFEIEDLPVAEEPYTDEAEEEREAYFLGLKDLENDYPIISSISVLLGENQALPIHWDNSDDESNNYWQQIVEQAEQQWSVTQNLTEGVNELTIQDDTTSVEAYRLNVLINAGVIDSDFRGEGLRSFLGILNYASSHIPNISKLLRPLYSKTSPHGDRRFKASDWAIIKEVKTLVQTLPDLELPPENAYIIIEIDGSIEGWGGVCKWKQTKFDPNKTEKICAYVSGKFSVIKSTIDAEIYACMEALSAMKIHYLDKKEITLRTYCHAIIKFFNKSVNNKPSRVRWITFTDYITGTGVDIKFEHIECVNNELADALSRLNYNGVIQKSDTCKRYWELSPGEPKITIVEEILTIDVKPGWKKGTKITFPEKGNESPNLVPADIAFIIDEKPHPLFRREGNDLVMTQKISLAEALTDYTAHLTTLDGRSLTIPISNVIHPGYKLVVAGEGMPFPKDPSRKGNLCINFYIKFPKRLTAEQKAHGVESARPNGDEQGVGLARLSRVVKLLVLDRRNYSRFEGRIVLSSSSSFTSSSIALSIYAQANIMLNVSLDKNMKWSQATLVALVTSEVSEDSFDGVECLDDVPLPDYPWFLTLK